MVTLKVFVEEECWSCCESRRLVAEIALQFPQIETEVIDLSQGRWPETIFAVPTYVLNDEIIALGNPYPSELSERLQSALKGM